ncbi:MAG: hypothetical protein KF799_07835 [Bdellovibrionales bacterium]|nr:hypothetical protein [Bdellovibrionales bacterium]
MSLTIKITNVGRDVHLSLEGVLDENCQLPEFPEVIQGELEICLEKLTMINSLGCRKWAHWIRAQAKTKGGVSLVKCSPAIMNQINILAGFLPEYARVDSFYVPYYCEGCGYEDRVLLTRGHEFDTTGLISFAEEVPCPGCKAIMAMEVLRERYFKFLARKGA